jgi:hypothetical protein
LLCDRCGFEIKTDQSFRSKYNGKHYCLSFADCERRVSGKYELEEIPEAAEREIAKINDYLMGNVLPRGEANEHRRT